MRFKDLSLTYKQFLSFGHILVIMAGVNTYTLYQMEAVKAEVDAVTNNWLPKVAAISALNLGTANLRTGQLQYAAADKTVQEEQAAALIDLIDQINTHRDDYEALNHSVAEKALYEDQFDPEWERYQDLSFLFFQYVQAGMEQEAVVLLNNQGREIFEGFSADLRELVSISQDGALWAAANAAVTYDRTRRVISLLLGVTVLFTVGLSVVLVRRITVPVQQLEKAARRVAAGDLDVRLESPGRDEIGGLTGSFNQMTAALHAAREETRRQAAALSETNRELADKSRSLEEKNSDLENALQALHETQEQLLLQEKMASLGRLVAGVAHEINNPVASVISNADVTRRCIERMEVMTQAGGLLAVVQDDRQWGQMVEILKNNGKGTLEAGERIATLVRSLKNFARLDEAEYQKANVLEGLDSALTLMESELRGRVEVVREYGEVPPIECYPGQLNQVFINLLQNASQAIEGQGQITVRGQVADGHIRIEIADTGKGIEAERLADIFDFGFSTEGQRVKMGSGLSTAYTIVQRHGGEIRLESQVGVGTLTMVSLPLKKSS